MGSVASDLLIIGEGFLSLVRSSRVIRVCRDPGATTDDVVDQPIGCPNWHRNLVISGRALGRVHPATVTVLKEASDFVNTIEDLIHPKINDARAFLGCFLGLFALAETVDQSVHSFIGDIDQPATLAHDSGD